MSNMVRAISENGGVVVCAVDSTNIVQEMERVHKPSAVVSAALGRLLTGASLMGSWLKSSDDSITLRINGGGPTGTLLAVSDGEGNVRGYVDHPIVEDLPERPDGKLNVGAAVGTDGNLSVVRDLGLKEPYIGQVPLVSGEIAEDITAYYATSEQTPSVCALGVLVNKDLSIKRAGGYILQLLPGATDEEITLIEKNIAKMDSVTDMLEKGISVEELALMPLEGFNPNVLDERDVEYKCYCSEEKTEKILISLGKDELQTMHEEYPIAQVECHFCDKAYKIEIENILKEIS